MKYLSKLLFFLSLALAFGCADNDPIVDNDPAQGDDDVLVTVNLDVPGHSLPSSRAIGADNERTINTLDVLVFQDDKFLYKTHAMDVQNGKAKVYLKKTAASKTNTLAFFANLKSEVDGALASFSTSDSKAVTLAKVKFSCSTAWNATSGSDFKPMPMYGELTGKTITATTTGTALGNVSMIRGLARVDVGFNFGANSGTDADAVNNEEPAGLTDYAIKKIKVYHIYKEGAAAPATIPVTTPTIPTGASIETAPKSFSYTPQSDGKGLVRGIYLPERDQKTLTEKGLETCILVSISHKNGTPTWYRMDFIDGTAAAGTRTILDVLRNHRYQFNITSILSAGRATEADALVSSSASIKYDLFVDNISEGGAVVFNGEYYLRVSPDTLRLEKWASDYKITANSVDYPRNKVRALTNYQFGGTAEKWTAKAHETTWLGVNGAPNSGSSYSAIDGTFGVSVTENTTGAPRVGYIKIAVPNDVLSYILPVVQSDEEVYSIDTIDPLTGDHLPEVVWEYDGTNPLGPQLLPTSNATQKFTVVWKPQSYPSPIAYRHENMSSGGIANITDKLPSTLNSGSNTEAGCEEVSVTLEAPVIPDYDLFQPCITRVSYYLYDSANNVTLDEAPILLRQVSYVLETNAQEIGYLTGLKRTLTVRSNASWEIVSIDDPDDLLDTSVPTDSLAVGIGATIVPGDLTSTKLPFRFKDKLGSDIKVVFASTDGKFTNVEAIIRAKDLGYTENLLEQNSLFYLNAVNIDVTSWQQAVKEDILGVGNFDRQGVCPDGYRLPTRNELILSYAYRRGWNPNGNQFATDGLYVPVTTSPYSPGFTTSHEFGRGTVEDITQDFGPLKIRCVREETSAGTKYPYVITDADGPIIVSRDAADGVRTSALHADWSNHLNFLSHTETSIHNGVAAKLQVANSNVGTGSWESMTEACEKLNIMPGESGWRLPTQRELLLISVMGGGATRFYIDNESSTEHNPAIGNDPLNAHLGYTPIEDSWYWTCTKSGLDPNRTWVVAVFSGQSFTLESQHAHGRCVRDVK